MKSTQKFGTILFLSSLLYAPIYAEKSISGSIGFSLSKSILGLSYESGSNEVNLGLKNNPVEFWGRYAQIQPGITLNHETSLQGLYVSLTYAPIHQTLEHGGPWIAVGRKGRSTFIGNPQYWERGWNSGEIFLGVGREFWFSDLGLHLDANFITPVTQDFMWAWSYWIGAGLSYRFKLE